MTSDTKTEVLSGELDNGCNKTNGVVKQNGITHRSATNMSNGTLPTDSPTKGKLPKEIGTDYNFKRKIVWFNALGFAFLHLLCLYSIWLLFKCNVRTTLWAWAVMLASGQGITMGAHRLFAHKTFKATWIVRLALIILQTIAGQNCLYVWARDHRLHHKYSDTDADPHNSHRGFFFSHIGWLMSRKHPAVISKGKTIDMSDLEADPLVMIQKKYYKSFYMLFSVAIPVAVPVYFWDETYINSFFVAFLLRYMIVLHATWSVNSAAHMFGTKPYDKTMRPVESWIVSAVSVGEGWHNYHHAFPWDYRASELGTKFNFTTMLIDLLASIGLVYDLRDTKANMVEHRVRKAGDGSHPKYGPMKIAKDADATKIEEHQVEKELESTNSNEDTIHTNGTLKEGLTNGECHKEVDTILVKDSATGESTTVKRIIVKDKQLLHD